MRILNPNPSYGTGFAGSKAESAFPEMWDGLMFAYGMFLGPTSQVQDWSGNKNLGTLTNGPTWVGGSLSLDGTDDFIAHADAGITGEMTILARVKKVTFFAGGTKSIASSVNNTGSSYNYFFGVENNTAGQRLEYSQANSGFILDGVTALTDGKWHNVAVTRSGSSGSWTITLFLDGKQDSTVGTALNPGSTLNNRIGQHIGGYFGGNIASVYMYNRPLKPAEIARWHRNPKGLFIRKQRALGFVAAAPPVTFVPQVIGPF